MFDCCVVSAVCIYIIPNVCLLFQFRQPIPHCIIGIQRDWPARSKGHQLNIYIGLEILETGAGEKTQNLTKNTLGNLNHQRKRSSGSLILEIAKKGETNHSKFFELNDP